MHALGSYRRRREAIYQSTRRVSAGGWKADVLHICVSTIVIAMFVGLFWWFSQSG